MISNLRACGLPDVCFSYIVRQFLVPAAGGLHKKIPSACLVVTKNYYVLDFARFFRYICDVWYAPQSKLNIPKNLLTPYKL